MAVKLVIQALLFGKMMKKRYLVVITESDKEGNMSKREADKRHLTNLDYPTDNNVKRSYIKKRPMLCKRKDIGSKELKI